MIPRELTRKGAYLLSYIDDFGGVATDQAKVVTHVKRLQDLLTRLGLQKAATRPPLLLK